MTTPSIILASLETIKTEPVYVALRTVSELDDRMAIIANHPEPVGQVLRFFRIEPE